MKKIWMVGLLAVLLLSPLKSSAQGITAGQSTGSIYLGLGSALGKSDLEVDGKNLSWGNIGAEGGLSYIYFPNEFIGLGVDLHFAGFKGSQRLEDVPGWWRWHTLKTEFNMNTTQLMAIGRLNLNPSSPVRMYIPFGAGVVLSEAKMKYLWDNREVYKEEDYNVSPGWYVGLGIEFDTNNALTWGVEFRYNSFQYDYSDFADFVGGRTISNNKERNYVSVVATLRF